MHNFHPVDISCGQLIQRYHIFRIVVFDFEEIGNLPIRLLRQPAAHLNVDTLVAPQRHKINSFVSFFRCRPHSLAAAVQNTQCSPA